MTATVASRARGDRGAVLVELALLLPFLSLLVFATMELGAAWVADARVDAATAQAARLGAVSGDRPTTDRDVLVALQASLPSAALARLDRVVVFKATDPTGAVPATCRRAIGDAADVTAMGCNSYSGATVRAVSKLSMTGFGGSPGTKDAGWAPTTRAASLVGPPDYLGLWVRVQHEGVTEMPFADATIVSRAVFRIQPDLAG